LTISLIHNSKGKIQKEIDIFEDSPKNNSMNMTIQIDGSIHIKIDKNYERLINSIRFPITDDSVLMKPTRDLANSGIKIESFESVC